MSAYEAKWNDDSINEIYSVVSGTPFLTATPVPPFQHSPTQQTAVTHPTTCDLYDAQRAAVCLTNGNGKYVCDTMLPCWSGTIDDVRRKIVTATLQQRPQ